MHRWNDELWLFTPDEYKRLPNGTVLTSISGETVTKGVDYIDMDTRAGYLAYGIKDPKTKEESELFIRLKLTV
jgi:hypothetical protein